MLPREARIRAGRTSSGRASSPTGATVASSPPTSPTRGSAPPLLSPPEPPREIDPYDDPMGLLANEERLRYQKELAAYNDQEWEHVRTTGFMIRNMKMIVNDAEWLQYAAKYKMPSRPGYNASGRPAQVTLNSYRVNAFPECMVYQWDIIIGNGNEKRGLIKAVWESNAVQKRLGNGSWIWDGNKIAWSKNGLPELEKQKTPKDRQKITFVVDMDEERANAGDIRALNAQVSRATLEQKEQRPRNQFHVQIRYATTINLATLSAYLQKKMAFDDSVTQTINFLSHLIRHTPAQRLVAIKNSFFPKNWREARDLGGGITAMKGIFQSIRMAEGGKMVVNVDVSHANFFKAKRMDMVACELANTTDTGRLIAFCQKDQPNPPYGRYKESYHMRLIKKLKKLAFNVNYPGISERTKARRWIVKDIMYTNAYSTSFKTTNRATGEEKVTNVLEYYRNVYGYRLEYPSLPLIETTKKGTFYPMEICYLEEGQRYPFKLDEGQTSNMIKFAVSRPDQRMASIQQGLANLDWAADPMHSNYGLKMAPQMIESQARVLDAPKVVFAGGRFEEPKQNGRWRIDGKKFYKPNVKPLKVWGVCVMWTAGRKDMNVTQQELLNFLRMFISEYRGYGGIVEEATPVMHQGDDNDPAKAVEALRNKIVAKYPDQAIQLMMVVMPRKVTDTYNRLKRSCDLRFGCVSQMMQAAHVKRCNPQYVGNVLMKVNAKLGGQSFKAMPIKGPVATAKGQYFAKPTMIIGADVSHPAPGSLQPSMAAITVSMDKEAIRYGSCVQSNGHRLEMITTWNWNDMLGPLAREWMTTLGGGRFPQHIIYFRDGVSEGQFEHVIQQELRDIRNLFKDMDSTPNKQNLANIKFTVIIASKRHHVRFFPKAPPASDRNKNAVPGVIVERDVTSPDSYDFYLCSHAAIQGTARPCHYTVIMDQAQMKPEILQNMIYEHSYQYIRSSTPVSLFPAVYYAHLASKRAVAHERTGKELQQHRSSEQRERDMLIRAQGEAAQTGKVMTKEALERLKAYTTNEYPPLIPSANPRLWNTMWYI